MIIDFHTHVGEVVGKTSDDLLRSMDMAQIDKSVIFAGDPLKFSNEELIKTIEQHPDRFLGVVYANPSSEYCNDYSKQFSKFLDHPSVIGAKFYCGYEYYSANSNCTGWFLQALNYRKKLAIFHMGDTYSVIKNAKLKYAQPISIDEIAVDHPNLKIVIAHLGFPWHRDTAQVLYKNSNVYNDVSGFVYGDFTEKDTTKFQTVLDEMKLIYNSTDRLLFGTDYPISSQLSYIKALQEMNLFNQLSSNTEQLISTVLNTQEVK